MSPRKIVGARIRNTGELEALEYDEFDLVATIEDSGQAPLTCPLVGLLTQLPANTSATTALRKFMDLGIVRRIQGPLIYEFTEIPGPCPYTQQTEDKQHG